MQETPKEKKPQKDSSSKKVVESYKIDTEEQHKKEDSLVEKIQVFVDEVKYQFEIRRKKKEKLKDLGLHEDFDPMRTYDVKSRQVAIKTWKDFFVVYLAMIFVIFTLIWYLVEAGYLLNPLDDLFGRDNTVQTRVPVPLPEVIKDKVGEKRDSVADLTNYVLLYSPAESEEVNGRIVIEGEASSNFRYLTVTIFDSSNNELGNIDVALTVYDSDYFPWETVVDVIKSPASTEGSIEVLAVDITGRELTQSFPISFASKTTPEVITLFTPIEDQIIKEETVLNILAEVNEDLVGDFKIQIIDAENRVLYDEILVKEGVYLSGSFVVPDTKDWGSSGQIKILRDKSVLIESNIRIDQ